MYTTNFIWKKNHFLISTQAALFRCLFLFIFVTDAYYLFIVIISSGLLKLFDFLSLSIFGFLLSK